MGKKPTNKDFNFYKLLNLVFLNEFIKVTSEKFRELLLQKILENNSFIRNSSQIFKIILENLIDSNPERMKDNFSSIKEENSAILKLINNAKNEFLDEVIMNIFETKISIYFESIPDLDPKALQKIYPKYYKDNKNSKIKNLAGIIFDNSLKIFEQVIIFLDTLSKTKPV